jgi:hypothetical protein
MIFLTLVLVNKSIKFRLKEKKTIFFFLEKRKKMYLISYSHCTFYSKSPQIKYTTKANKTTQKKYKGP